MVNWKNWIDGLAKTLLVVGGFNWFLYLWNFNLVERIFMSGSFITGLIYTLVGASAVWTIYRLMK